MKSPLPWVAIPLFAILACQTPPEFGGVSLRPIHLSIPLAAYLAHRFGRRGLLAVAAGLLVALYAVNIGWPLANFSADLTRKDIFGFFELRPVWPFLPMSLVTPFGAVRHDFAVYVLAFAVAIWVTGASNAKPGAAPWPGWRPVNPALSIVATALLPIGLTLYSEDWGGGFTIVSVLDLQLLLYAWVLALGLLGAKPALVIGTLAVACGFGLALELRNVADDLSRSFAFRLHYGGGVYFENVRYGLRSPVRFFVSMACFAVGCELRRASLGDAVGRGLRGPSFLFAVLLLLWGGALAFEILPSGSMLQSIAQRLQLLGDARVVPFVALFAGAAYRLRGVAVVVAFSLLLTVLKLTLLHLEHFLPVPLEEPFSALSFGALGVALGERLTNSRTEWHVLHWMAYLAILLIVVPQWFDLQDPGQFVWPAAAITALMAAAGLFTWLWQRTFGPSTGGTPAGWLAFATLILLVTSLGPHLMDAATSLASAASATHLFTELVAQMNSDGELSDASLRLAVAPAYLAVFFAVAAKFLKSLPQIADDVKGVVDWARRLNRGPASAVSPTHAGQNAAGPWRGFATSCARVARWAAGVASVVAGCVFVLSVRHLTPHLLGWH